MPAEFVLEFRDDNGEWCDHGRYGANLFQRLDDGSYVCAGHGGSPTFLRCVARLETGIQVDYPDGTSALARLTPVHHEPAQGGRP